MGRRTIRNAGSVGCVQCGRGQTDLYLECHHTLISLQAGNIEHIIQPLRDLIGAAQEVYTDVPVRTRERSTFARLLNGTARAQGSSLSDLLQRSTVKALRPMMNELRAFKSDAELSNLRRAGQASGQAFTEAMKKNFRSEKELETYIEYMFKFNGCEQSAYVPVVAGGDVSREFYARLTLSPCINVSSRMQYRFITFAMMQQSSMISVKSLSLNTSLTSNSHGELITVDAGGVSMTHELY